MIFSVPAFSCPVDQSAPKVFYEPAPQFSTGMKRKASSDDLTALRSGDGRSVAVSSYVMPYRSDMNTHSFPVYLDPERSYTPGHSSSFAGQQGENAAAPQNLKGMTGISRTKALFVAFWLTQQYEAAENVSLPRNGMYSYYMEHCRLHSIDPVNAATFGKIIRTVFPHIKTRRLGTRGNSKYHYYGITYREGYYPSVDGIAGAPAHHFSESMDFVEASDDLIDRPDVPFGDLFSNDIPMSSITAAAGDLKFFFEEVKHVESNSNSGSSLMALYNKKVNSLFGSDLNKGMPVFAYIVHMQLVVDCLVHFDFDRLHDGLSQLNWSDLYLPLQTDSLNDHLQRIFQLNDYVHIIVKKNSMASLKNALPGALAAYSSLQTTSLKRLSVTLEGSNIPGFGEVYFGHLWSRLLPILHKRSRLLQAMVTIESLLTARSSQPFLLENSSALPFSSTLGMLQEIWRSKIDWHEIYELSSSYLLILGNPWESLPGPIKSSDEASVDNQTSQAYLPSYSASLWNMSSQPCHAFQNAGPVYAYDPNLPVTPESAPFYGGNYGPPAEVNGYPVTNQPPHVAARAPFGYQPFLMQHQVLSKKEEKNLRKKQSEFIMKRVRSDVDRLVLSPRADSPLVFLQRIFLWVDSILEKYFLKRFQFMISRRSHLAILEDQTKKFLVQWSHFSNLVHKSLLSCISGYFKPSLSGYAQDAPYSVGAVRSDPCSTDADILEYSSLDSIPGEASSSLPAMLHSLRISMEEYVLWRLEDQLEDLRRPWIHQISQPRLNLPPITAHPQPMPLASHLNSASPHAYSQSTIPCNTGLPFQASTDPYQYSDENGAVSGIYPYQMQVASNQHYSNPSIQGYYPPPVSALSSQTPYYVPETTTCDPATASFALRKRLRTDSSLAAILDN